MAELADMKLFVQTVRAGSLSAAGRLLGFSPAVGSKRLARLEADLGTRLLQRSSRRLALTEEGAIYFEHCQAILAQVDEAEAAVGRGRQQAQGVLRISSPVALGRRWIGPALARFAAAHPAVTVQLSLSDALVDLLEDGYDCAIRIGGPPDSRLAARPLAENQRIVCAAPAYLSRHGRPQRPEDLAGHACLITSRNRATLADWRFWPRDAGPRVAPTVVRVGGRLVCDNGDQAHDWCLAGLGVARRSILDVREELADGRLVELLPAWTGERAPVQLVFPSRRFLPARTRFFIEQLVAEFATAL